MHLPQYIYPKEFQKPKSESLFHDLLFQCFIFLIFRTNYDINYL